MTRIRCFLLEPTQMAEHSLRRFTFGSSQTCSGGIWGHDANAVLGAIAFPGDLNGDHTRSHPKDDPRWPTECLACGYRFTPEDEYQVSIHRYFRRSDNGDMALLSRPPIGAMWWADWLIGTGMAKNSPDGRVLIVQTPGGQWCVDGDSTNGPGWSRIGEPPHVTVKPSILFDGYHGWLTDGWLIEC